MASLEAAQRARWLNIALGAAAASGARGRDLKQLRWMAFQASHDGMLSVLRCSPSSDDAAEVIEEYEEVLSAFAQATQNPLKLIGALHLLRSHGRDDLAKACQESVQLSQWTSTS